MVDPQPWRWFFSQADPSARMLTFARGIDIEALIEGFGMDPTTTESMTSAEADERFLRQQPDFNTPPFYIRVVELNGWVLAFEHGQVLDLIERVPRVPSGTDTFGVSWTLSYVGFQAVIDGQLTMFDPITVSGHHGNLLATLAAPWRSVYEERSDDYMPTLLAAFADALGIPPVTIEIVSASMTTAWRDH